MLVLVIRTRIIRPLLVTPTWLMRPGKTGIAYWVTSFITSRPVCVYRCLQLRELQYSIYMYGLECGHGQRYLTSGSITARVGMYTHKIGLC